jgi:hypothetical protein
MRAPWGISRNPLGDKSNRGHAAPLPIMGLKDPWGQNKEAGKGRDGGDPLPSSFSVSPSLEALPGRARDLQSAPHVLYHCIRQAWGGIIIPVTRLVAPTISDQ